MMELSFEKERLSKRDSREIEETLGEYVDSLEGVYCGAVVLNNPHAVINTATELTVGAHMAKTLSGDGLQGATASSLERINGYLEERQRPLGKRVAAKLGQLVTLSDALNNNSREDLSTLLLSAREALDKQQTTGFTLEGNLLAPDFSINDADAIGSPTVACSRNLYFIGDTTVDQGERADGFWRAVDAIASRTGFAEYTNYADLGLGELLVQMLKDADESTYLTESEKVQIGDGVLRVAKARCTAVAKMQNLQESYLDVQKQYQHEVAERQKALVEQYARQSVRERYGVKTSNVVESTEVAATKGLTNSEVSQQIKNIDQAFIGAVAHFFANTREICTKAEERYIKGALMSIYARDVETSSFQHLMWNELSRALAQHHSDPYSEQARTPASFIADIPEMTEVCDVENMSKEEIVRFYEAFYDNYANERLPLKSLEDFMNSIKTQKTR